MSFGGRGPIVKYREHLLLYPEHLLRYPEHLLLYPRSHSWALHGRCKSMHGDKNVIFVVIGYVALHHDETRL